MSGWCSGNAPAAQTNVDVADDRAGSVHKRLKIDVLDYQKMFKDTITAKMKLITSFQELEKFREGALQTAKFWFSMKCPGEADEQFVKQYGTQLEVMIYDKSQELWNGSAKESKKKTHFERVREEVLNFYLDEMQKIGEKVIFAWIPQLDQYHEDATWSTFALVAQQTQLKVLQKNALELEINEIYEKFRKELELKPYYAPPAIGIDFGNTCLRVAAVRQHKVTVIPIEEDSDNDGSMAAYVMYNRDGARVVGNEAKRRAHENPRNTIYDLKRIIGKKMDDPGLQQDKKSWPFELVGMDGSPRIKVYENLVTPEQIVADLFSQCKVMAAKHLKWEPNAIRNAVITVPNHFNENQRKVLKDAGRLARLDVLLTLDDPIAVAIPYALGERKEGSNFLIFDLGESNFDVCVLRTGSYKSLRILGRGGDMHLGGKNLDQKLVDYCVQQFTELVRIDLTAVKDLKEEAIRTEVHRHLDQLLVECENARRYLCTEGMVTTVSINKMFGELDRKVKVTRKQFEKLNMPLFQRMIDIVQKVLWDAFLLHQEIDKIFLVGSYSSIPKVQKMLRAHFGGKAPTRSVSPVDVVAIGAAMQADQLQRNRFENEIDMKAELEKWITVTRAKINE